MKYPFCHKENLPEDDETGFCMVKSDGMWSLKHIIIKFSRSCMCALMHYMQILLCGHKRKLQLNVFIGMTGS